MTTNEMVEAVLKHQFALSTIPDDAYEAIEGLVDVARKYQKIEAQVDLSEKENHVIDVARMIQIREIVYGND